MTQRKRFFRQLLIVAACLLAAAVGPVALAKDPQGYVCFTYRVTTCEGLTESVTTWVIPLGEGRYRVVTRTELVTDAGDVRLGFFGGSLRSLGLYTTDGAGLGVDLAWLGGVSELGLEPGKKYLLPDGGVLQMGDRVTVAGLSGIEGVFTHAANPAVRVTVVVADDPEVRDLLPLPLRLTIEYDYSKLAGSDIAVRPQSGTIVLVAFTRDQSVGGAP